MSLDVGKKRVLFIDHTASLGGGEIALLNLVSNLNHDRYEPVVLLFSTGPLVQRLAAAGIETHVVSLAASVINARKDSLGPKTLMRLPQVLRSIVFTWRISRFIRRNRIDLVHTNSLKADLLGGLAAKIARKPLIWHIRDRIDNDYLPRTIVQAFRWLCRYVPDYVIANSAATLATVRLGRAERSTAIASGIDLRTRVVHDGMNQASAAQPINGDDDDERSGVVGLVGRIARWKGQHIFLEAAARVHQRFPRVRFQIIGAPLFDERDYENEIHAIAQRLKLTHYVEFTGFREDVQELIGRLEVLVHASITAEPFGQVVTEGMLAAKPVVATAGGGVLEIVVDGVTGLLVPMGDAQAMSESICQLLENRDTARRMGQVGRQRVLQNFTIEQTAARIESVYDEIFPVNRLLSSYMPRAGILFDSRIVATVASLGFVGMGFAIGELLRDRYGQYAPMSSLFLLAVALSTRLFGVKAGLLSTVASLLAVAYMLLPGDSWIVDRLHLPTLVLFTTVALVITPLIGNLRKAERRARAAQAAAERARVEADFIARAAAAFAICSTPLSVVQAMTHLANTALGDWCVVDLVQEDGSLWRAGVAHCDTSKYEPARRLPTLGAPTAADDPVVRTIRSHRVTRFDPGAKGQALASQESERIELYSELGTAHGIVVPIHSAGRTLGAISLFRTDPDRPYQSGDSTLACEFAWRAAVALAGMEPGSSDARIAEPSDASLRVTVAAHV